MKYKIFILFFLVQSLLISSSGQLPYEPAPSHRNALKWPFNSTSIWNMPIGSDAQYTHAYIESASQAGMTFDEDYIVLTPNEPLMDIYWSNAGWGWDADRCKKDGGLLISLPIPQDFIVSPQTWDGRTPNAGIAVLMPDGKTIKQTQPFAHCEEGSFGTSQYLFDDADLFGDGYYGAHGGSYLSTIGGALRVDELTPTSGPIRHALKVNLYGRKNIYYDSNTRGYRWPAKTADSYAKDNYYKNRTNPIVKECRMGALLALPATMSIASLELKTEPARILAQAFQDYGAYLVDDTGWDVWAIVTEWGPDGRFVDQFQKNWGFSFPSSTNSDFGKDMDKIFTNLHVVTNNTSNSIGGGGTPRAPMAPPFKASTANETLIQEDISYSIQDENIILYEKEGEAALFDCTGKLLLKTNVAENKSIDISNINSGLYFLSIGNKSVKFMKK